MTPDRRSVGPAPTLEHAAGRSRRTGFWLVAAAAICWSSGGLIARLVGTGPALVAHTAADLARPPRRLGARVE